jgi:hypothetical protein
MPARYKDFIMRNSHQLRASRFRLNHAPRFFSVAPMVQAAAQFPLSRLERHLVGRRAARRDTRSFPLYSPPTKKAKEDQPNNSPVKGTKERVHSSKPRPKRELTAEEKEAKAAREAARRERKNLARRVKRAKARMEKEQEELRLSMKPCKVYIGPRVGEVPCKKCLKETVRVPAPASRKGMASVRRQKRAMEANLRPAPMCVRANWWQRTHSLLSHQVPAKMPRTKKTSKKVEEPTWDAETYPSLSPPILTDEEFSAMFDRTLNLASKAWEEVVNCQQTTTSVEQVIEDAIQPGNPSQGIATKTKPALVVQLQDALEKVARTFMLEDQTAPKQQEVHPSNEAKYVNFW